MSFYLLSLLFLYPFLFPNDDHVSDFVVAAAAAVAAAVAVVMLLLLPLFYASRRS